MANRQLFASTRGRLASPANARNEAGGLAYAFSPKAALAQLAMTGTLANAFYADTETQLASLLEVARQVEPRDVAQVAIFARRQSYMKDTPAVLVAWLTSSIPHSPSAFSCGSSTMGGCCATSCRSCGAARCHGDRPGECTDTRGPDLSPARCLGDPAPRDGRSPGRIQPGELPRCGAPDRLGDPAPKSKPWRCKRVGLLEGNAAGNPCLENIAKLSTPLVSSGGH
ncbi:TROVE domain-containing protein [Thiocystis violascens DSM 198]|uniref:TROVE domain-containing protein n=1 Tax=Thiocystis violascens (strain ATCC 17096 / DSM 198 / 6111) TaxID=765911 RepID=I3YCS7_THIV6|nr:TROVE domain-containing protein [Thiocystis violascens DSM 198]